MVWQALLARRLRLPLVGLPSDLLHGKAMMVLVHRKLRIDESVREISHRLMIIVGHL